MNELEFNLRRTAIATYKKEEIFQSKLWAEKLAEDSKRTALAFREWFGGDPDFVSGWEVQSGTTRLRYYAGTDNAWAVLGICPVCKEAVESPMCWRLEDIGKYLADFQPHWTHVHRSRFWLHRLANWVTQTFAGPRS